MDITLTIPGLVAPVVVASVSTAPRYCFRYLKADNVAIIDVDVDGSLSEAAALAILDAWCVDHPTRWRVYRTHAGLRYIETSSLWRVRTSVVQDMFTALHADGGYVQICSAFTPELERGAFYARLDPKPWYLPDGPSSAALLAMSDEDFATYKTGTYDPAIGDYAVCEYLGIHGDSDRPVHGWAQAVIDYHDAQTRATSGDTLA